MNSEDVLINVNAFETRVAVLENGRLQELHLQRADGASVTGNVYRGRVVRILPGMQAAFVDIGLERPGFLHAKDIRGSHWPDVEAARQATRPPPPIERLLAEGQAVVVQVLKDPISTKGARLTTHLALPSRFLVLMPFSDHVGVSQRIEDDAERERLRALVLRLRGEAGLPDSHGFIVRTVADGATELALRADMAFLARLWSRVDAYREAVAPPALVYEDLPLHVRVIRDLVDANVASIRIDCADTHAALGRFVDRFLPELGDRLLLHDEATPLFERFGVEAELERALSTRVPLPSGGYLIIEQTEAMTTIDVNTGAFVGARSLEDTVFRTNLEAAEVVPRQLRLRNLGGIVVIDFIDMDAAEHRREVLRILEQAAAADPARIRVSGISTLGLVELSRKRTRESLVQQLCEPCPHCLGRGYGRTAESISFEILRTLAREARRQADAGPAVPSTPRACVVRAGQAVIDHLLDDNAADVDALAARIGMPIRLQLEPCYGVEQFDVVTLQDVD
ncbi:MAG TPA: Rne/Rng family ribonuclease [Pseudomonadales bacterium]|nr:Rne/Rng family ribonuclease [Pseudomonadales bacterium]